MIDEVIHEVVPFEEFYGLNDYSLESVDWVNTNLDSTSRDMVNEVLVVLQFFYNEHKDDSVNEWLQLKKMGLRKELLDVLNKVFNTCFDDLVDEQNNLWSLPVDFVLVEHWQWREVFKYRVDAILDKLFGDIYSKAVYYRDFPMPAGSFQVESDFKRSIRGLTNLVDYNTGNTVKWVEREYLVFVYGEDALFNWICSGVNTCEWCYSVERGNPYRLSELPLDHINGHCKIVPVYPDDFTDDYLKVRLV